MIERVFTWTDRLMLILALAGMAALSVTIGVVIADITMRSTVGRSILGTVDITQLAVMTCAFWAIPFTFLRGGHVTVEIATGSLPPRLRAVMDGLAALLGAVFVAMIGWYGWTSAQQAMQYGDLSQNLGIPMILYWVPLISGCALSVVATLVVAARHFALAVRRPTDG